MINPDSDVVTGMRSRVAMAWITCRLESCWSRLLRLKCQVLHCKLQMVMYFVRRKVACCVTKPCQSTIMPEEKQNSVLHEWSALSSGQHKSRLGYQVFAGMLGSILGLAGELNGVVLRLEYGDTPLPAQDKRRL